MKIPESVDWVATGKTLGEGGQGVIRQVKAKDDRPGSFAMKKLSDGKPKKAYERFAREIEAIKLLEHPYIIKIFDHSSSDADFHFYVMEHVEGAKSLKKIVGTENNPFHGSALRSLGFFQKILSAFSCLEDNKITHRDLSLGNVLLLPDKSIRIIDFGLCQSENSETITLIDEGVGTQNYMAPECESGATAKIGIPADLYSAAKILWSVITNQQAFSRESPVFKERSMYQIFPDKPECWHLRHIFEKTIRHSVSNRWKTVGEAIAKTSEVMYLINAGFPPLEMIIKDSCPNCGFGRLNNFNGSQGIFGNHKNLGILAKKCDRCGLCIARDYSLLQENVNGQNPLE